MAVKTKKNSTTPVKKHPRMGRLTTNLNSFTKPLNLTQRYIAKTSETKAPPAPVINTDQRVVGGQYTQPLSGNFSVGYQGNSNTGTITNQSADTGEINQWIGSHPNFKITNADSFMPPSSYNNLKVSGANMEEDTARVNAAIQAGNQQANALRAQSDQDIMIMNAPGYPPDMKAIGQQHYRNYYNNQSLSPPSGGRVSPPSGGRTMPPSGGRQSGMYVTYASRKQELNRSKSGVKKTKALVVDLKTIPVKTPKPVNVDMWLNSGPKKKSVRKPKK